jgi:endonuclease/exonuclease/phosphatase family metal-dependent hydrolase
MNTNSTFSVANFNVHAGIDGWGRRFDAVGACERIGADILIIEEDWVADDPTDSIGPQVATKGGYAILTASSGRGRRLLPPDDESKTPARWAPHRVAKQPKPIRLDNHARSSSDRHDDSGRAIRSTPGMWATSLLSRFPILDHKFVPLPVLPRDDARRQAIFATIDTGGTEPLTLIGVHLGHLTRGSTRQMRQLRSAIAEIPGEVILVGDLNCWGPPLRIFLRGVHDTVVGPTWPAWRPHSRIDHILTRDCSRVVHAQVLTASGSDHLPICATFSAG